MFSQKKIKGPFTADELRECIYNMNSFLTPPSQRRLTLDTLSDGSGSNHLMVAAAYNRDNESIASVIRLLMPLIPNINFLCRVVEEEKSDFKGWTVATCAAEADTQALQTIFACLPKIVNEENLAEEQKSLAQLTLDSGPFTGYSMVHFAAMGGSRRNLELLDLHGAELCVELPTDCKGDNGKSYAKWTPLDLAIEKWASTDKKSEKYAFSDAMDYFLAYVRENKKGIKLSTIIENVQSRHSSYLTATQLKEIIPLIHKGYRNAPYVQLTAPTVSAAPTRSTTHKRKTDFLEEAKAAAKTKKPKQDALATTALSSSAAMAVSLDQDKDLKSPKEQKLFAPTFTFTPASRGEKLVEDQKQQIEKLETENTALKKELAETLAKLNAALAASTEKDKKLVEEHKQTEKLKFALYQSQCLFTHSKSQRLDAEHENLELRLKLNEKEKELMTREAEINGINRDFPELAARRLAKTSLPDDERDEDISPFLSMPLSPRS